MGREQRTFTGARRTAIEIRDGGCTDQVNGGLFCWTHHREIEKNEWEAVHHRGRIWLKPPARLDPNRAPRINNQHRPLPPRHDWPPGALGQGPP